MQDAETPVQGETQSAEALGTTQPQATGTESTTAPESTVEQPTVSLEDLTAQLEAERKERQKIEMRARQLENERKEQELKKLEETENYKELAEQYKAQLAEREEAEAQAQAIAEAKKFREDTINSYPDPKTREAALKLLSKNESALSWGDANSWDEAGASLIAQLDALKEVVSPEQSVQVPSNNPGETQTQTQTVDRSEAIAQAAKTRNFADILKTIPSVQQQIDALNE